MKKILFATAAILALFCMLRFSEVHAAYNKPNWEFLPNGINYLDSNNFIHYEEGTLKTLYTYRYIKVKNNTDYTFYNYKNGNFEVTSLNVQQFNTMKESIVLNFYESDTYNKFHFNTGTDTSYIKISFDLTTNVNTLEDYWIADRYFILHEDIIDPNDYPVEELLYLGPRISYQELEHNQVSNIQTNVNDPITINEIQNSIVIIDDYDGDITNEMEIITDEYSENSNILGNYQIVFKATDTFDNTSTFTLNIEVYDDSNPIITGTNIYRTNQINPIDINTIKSAITANDNYDGNISDNLILVSDNYSQNFDKLGTYQIIYEVSDSSNNSSSYTVTVIVEDKVAPIIKGPAEFIIGNDETLTIEQISEQISASDDVDGVLTPFIIGEDYSKNYNKVGSYFIEYKVVDSAGNTDYHIVDIIINDKIPPIFFLNNSIINISLNANMMNVNQIIDVVKSHNNISDFDYEIISDTYSSNLGKSGTYYVVLDVNNENYQIKVNILDDDKIKEPSIDDSNINIFTKIWKSIINIGRNIGIFFRRTWESLF